MDFLSLRDMFDINNKWVIDKTTLFPISFMFHINFYIALLKLKRPLQLDTYANVVCLPGLHDNFKSVDICKVMGWGATKAQGSRHDLLHEASVKLVPRDICNLPLSYNGTVHERALCAGYKSIKTDACEFDSGGEFTRTHNAISLHKKWSFPLRTFSVNATKSAVNCGFDQIYWRNPQWKISFLVQCFL